MPSTFAPSRRHFNAMGGALALTALAPCAWADNTFPSKQVRIVVPFSPGGPTDLMARAIGKIMSTNLGQPVIIDNKPGGGGVIGMSEVKHQPADGYTLVFPSILAVTNPALMPGYPLRHAARFRSVDRGGFRAARGRGAHRFPRA
ncbi:tripartite-type tricarboxylate transporter receptor subunit TctC [Variovorax boronicumulans]|uniref:Tripartite-type tricarboxylate transporter receptor subunit TctC n=1 Tax=Variovorax boronicumulans TaxID=436515 RepID=A0AAW8CTU3_9BURK|nr:tripartite tricarboxylate transporter substrate-binding protein [Variovorax boronicumulans]MDP9891659.1 tripartite-type tricarboxylate transporter receptor subunit TctC [Variovorax boronicumulans]MDQ0052832.1 tripartite-type tricarboxylate transporter receptor subunit TctC [Variovorax boronicumulans]